MSEQITINGKVYELNPLNPEVIPLKIGDPVKLLMKSNYGSEKYKTYQGVIASFDNFKDIPTINVVYLDTEYSTCTIKTVAINDGTPDIQIALLDPESKELDINQATILETFDRQIEVKKKELADLFYKKSYFEKNFGKFFTNRK